MSKRAHINTKREIQYADGTISAVKQTALADWLAQNGVDVCGADTDEWEIKKSQLESADKRLILAVPNDVATVKEMREFVFGLLDAPTGDYTYVSWF